MAAVDIDIPVHHSQGHQSTPTPSHIKRSQFEMENVGLSTKVICSVETGLI